MRSDVKYKQESAKTTTDIIYKCILEAVEKSKYGCFWVCPNGSNNCKYKHSLPEGFVLKTKEQLKQLAAPKITLEDFIEVENSKITYLYYK